MPSTPELLAALDAANQTLAYCTQDLGSKCDACDAQHATYDAQVATKDACSIALDVNLSTQASLAAQIQSLTDQKNQAINDEAIRRHDLVNAEQAVTNGAQDVERAELAKYQAEVAKQAAVDAVAAIQAQIDAE